MLENYFDSPVTLERLRSGLAGPFIEDFAEGLRRAGYSRSTIRGHLGASAHLGHWAQEKGLTGTDLNEEVGRIFWRHLSNCKCPCHPGKYRNQAVASVRLFLSHLRQTAIIPPPLVGNQQGARTTSAERLLSVDAPASRDKRIHSSLL